VGIFGRRTAELQAACQSAYLEMSSAHCEASIKRSLRSMMEQS